MVNVCKCEETLFLRSVVILVTNYKLVPIKINNEETETVFNLTKPLILIEWGKHFSEFIMLYNFACFIIYRQYTTQ